MSKPPSSSLPPLPSSDADPVAHAAGSPRTLVCSQCATRIAHTSRLVSTAFRGHSGRAALFTETWNVALDPPSILLMDSGAYTIQEFICKTCESYLGWKFVRAHDGSERWKEGHFILEFDLVQEQELAEADAEVEDGEVERLHPVQTRAAEDASVVATGLHRRTTSVDPRPPKGVRQGMRSIQAAPKVQRRLEVEDFEDGPFWKPR